MQAAAWITASRLSGARVRVEGTDVPFPLSFVSGRYSSFINHATPDA